MTRLHDPCPRCGEGKMRCQQTARRRNWRVRYLRCDACEFRAKEIYQLYPQSRIAAISSPAVCPHCSRKIEDIGPENQYSHAPHAEQEIDPQ